MNCPNCNAPVNPGEKFCRSCGKEFVLRRESPKQPPPKTQVEMRKVKPPPQSSNQPQQKPPTNQPNRPVKQSGQNRLSQNERRQSPPKTQQDMKKPPQLSHKDQAPPARPTPKNPPKTQVEMNRLKPTDLQKGSQDSTSPKKKTPQTPDENVAKKRIDNVGETSGFESVEIKPGAIFAKRYKILKEIGRGGMGSIYRADDMKLKEPVALKLLLPGLQSDQQVIQRFIQEIKLALKITHENVVRIYDIGEVGRIHFISMEFIEGIDLKRLIRSQGKLPLDYGIEIIQQICNGLGAAHKKGITHRDVKPQNVLISKDNIAKIVDFGIAKIETSDGMTREGVVIGTPEYMSPEQALAKKIDYRTDIYSVGAIMFEVFTGQLPFQADTPLGIALKHVNEAPPSPRSLNGEIPQFLENIILKALEKNTDDRYQSIEDIVIDLDRLKDGNFDSETVKSPEKVKSTTGELEALDTATLFAKGMNLFNQRNYREALQHFEMVLRKEPNHPKAYDYLEITGSQIAKEASVKRLLTEGEQAFDRGDFPAAMNFFTEADELVPDNPEIQIALRKVRAALSSMPQTTQPTTTTTIQQTEQIQTGKDAHSDFERGKAFYDKKSYEEAIEAFNIALSKDPNHTQSYEYLELAKAAKAAQGEIEHHYLTAKRLIEEEDISDAKTELQIVLDYDPNHEEARKLLEKLDNMTPEKQTSAEEVELDLDHVPVDMEQEPPKEKIPDRDPEYMKLIEKAKGQAQDNQYKEALVSLKTAQDNYPDYPETEQYIKKLEDTIAKKELSSKLSNGKELFQYKKYRQASRVFTQLLEQYPNHKEARQWLDKTRKAIIDERKQIEETRNLQAQRQQTVSKPAPGEIGEAEKKPSALMKYLPILIGGGVVIILIAVVVSIFVIYPSLQKQKIFDLKSQAKSNYAQAKYNDAAQDFQRLYDLQPELETLELLAKSYYFGDSFLKAQEVFQNLIKINGDIPEYYFYLGKIHDRKGDYQKAIASYQRIIDLESNNSEAYKSIGTIYFDQRLFEQAIRYFTISLELSPQQADVQLKIAEAYLAQNKVEEAEIEFKKTVQIDPRMLTPYLKLVEIYQNHDRIDEAITMLNDVLTWNSSNAEIFCLLGGIYEELSKKEDAEDIAEMTALAIENLQKCVIIDPKKRDATIKLSRLHSSLGHLDKAASVYISFLNEFPDDGEIHFELAVIYHRLKNYKGAFNHYFKAKDLMPEDPKVWANLGTLFYDTGNLKDAKKAFKRSLELDPDQDRVRRFYEKIKRKF